MSEYIKLFNNHNEYTAFTQTEDFVKPNVSHCITENEMHYNPINANGHAYVNLGLPSGTLWATMNIGANSETDYGFYFQWGDINGYTAEQVTGSPQEKAFSWADYKYANGRYNKLTKYCNKATYGNDGFTDNLTTLELSDDAARANWGGDWEIPSKEQIRELISGTTNGSVDGNGIFTIFAWDENTKFSAPTENTASTGNHFSGVAGQLYFNSNIDLSDALAGGAYLFFPAACHIANGVFQSESTCYYWSNSFDVEYEPNTSPSLGVLEWGQSVYFLTRSYGLSVRGVLG